MAENSLHVQQRDFAGDQDRCRQVADAVQSEFFYPCLAAEAGQPAAAHGVWPAGGRRKDPRAGCLNEVAGHCPAQAGCHGQPVAVLGAVLAFSGEQAHLIAAEVNILAAEAENFLLSGGEVEEAEQHELILTNYDAIHHILMDGSYVGFAIPMSSGLFKVVRFSLLGSDKAMRKVEEEVHRQAPRNGETYL